MGQAAVNAPGRDDVIADPARTARIDAILAEREASGLRVPVIVRLLLAALVLPSISGVLIDMEGVGGLQYSFYAVLSGWAVLNVYFFTLLRKKRHVARVGLVGALLDVAIVAAQLMMGTMMLDNMDVPPTAVFKSQLPAFGVALVAINALALRPRYPLVVGAGCFAALGASLLAAMSNPGFVVSSVPSEYMAGPAAGVGELVNLFLLYVFVTTAIVFVTHVARKTIRQTISQELATADIQRQQLEIVMREKVQALAKLVAGVSHELNSPLAVIQSGLDTQDKGLAKIEVKLAEGDRKLVNRLRSISSSLTEATARIASTAESLRSFADLDEAEFQKVDLNARIDQLLQRHPPPDDKQIAVERSIGDVPDIYANGKELTQALATILDNAFDAIEDEGTVEIRVNATESEVTIAIVDSGRGIAPEDAASLFDVTLRAGNQRVAASFGLPAAQSVAHRHGGHISVDSEVGRGSTFTLHIPIDSASLE
jgi:signal transduction histidine kinase